MTGPFFAASGLTPRCSACSVVLTGKYDRCPHCGAAQTTGLAAHLNGARGAVGHAASQVGAQIGGLMTGHLTGPHAAQTRAPATDYAGAAAGGDFTGLANAGGVRRVGWGPSSSAALSLFVFVLVFALAVMLGRSRFEHDDPHVAAVRLPGAQLTPISTSLPPPGAAPQIAPLRGTPPQPAADAALTRARACNTAKAWGCVSDAAREVVARDPGNREAQALLERAIAQTGWQDGAERVGVNATTTTNATTAPAAHAAIQSNGVQPEAAAAASSANPAPSLHAVLLSGASDDAKQRAISSMGWNTAASSAR